jgi:hypothetical protein
MDASKPSSLRLAGFLCLAIGGLVLGVGSLMTWAVVGVVGSHALDSTIKGTDIWDGQVTLAIAVVALVGVLAVRLVRSGSVRRLIAVAIAIGGLFATGLAIGDAIRIRSRFTGDLTALEKIAKALADTTRRPVVEILTQLEQRLSQLVTVTRGRGLWLVIAGGILTAAGGALTVAWANSEGGSGTEQIDEATVEASEAPASTATPGVAETIRPGGGPADATGGGTRDL